MRRFERHFAGFTLLEVLIALALSAVVFVALAGVVNRAADSRGLIDSRNSLQRDARFAMERMKSAVLASQRLVLPLPDTALTAWREHVREQTIPPSAPESGSTLATAVLAVTTSPTVDLNGDGVPDADNDADGRIDEDPGGDLNFDGAAGIMGIDDDGDGSVDESNKEDDDEDQESSSLKDEDAINGIDDDADGLIDEDPDADLNDDGAAGIVGVDDDGDGLIDESSKEDDDEDEDTTGNKDEDWWDTRVFFLDGNKLIERHPVPWDENGDAAVDGSDYVESTIAENVTRLRIERVPPGPSGIQLIDITLELTAAGGEQVALHTRIRLGAAL